MAPSQKQKNIVALHSSAKHLRHGPLLEVSTKSLTYAGVMLSAFNLTIQFSAGHATPVESAFQGSKVFESGGPYCDLYEMPGARSKKDSRLKTSGRLKGFSFNGEFWPLEPKTAFYDWLYIKAVHSRTELHSELLTHNGFTDIEFNPKKSINCQARSCALYVALSRRSLVERVIGNRDEFLKLLTRDSFYQTHSQENRQGKLF